MTRVLVVHYSRTGTTKKVATAIADRLGADLEEIVDRNRRSGLFGYVRSAVDAVLGRSSSIAMPSRDPLDYDLIILGSPTWNAALASPMRAYLERHRDQLGAVAFFATCGGRGGERVLRQMERLSGEPPKAVLVVREAEVASGAYLSKVDRFVNDLRRTLERLRPPAAAAPPPPAS